MLPFLQKMENLVNSNLCNVSSRITLIFFSNFLMPAFAGNPIQFLEATKKYRFLGPHLRISTKKLKKKGKSNVKITKPTHLTIGFCKNSLSFLCAVTKLKKIFSNLEVCLNCFVQILLIVTFSERDQQLNEGKVHVNTYTDVESTYFITRITKKKLAVGACYAVLIADWLVCCEV